MNFVTERTLKTNAINHFFELHETISKQEKENWSDLAFLSKQLEDTSLGTMHAVSIGVTSKTINKDDAEMLVKLGSFLDGTSLISKSNLSAKAVEEIKLDLIRFNTILTEQGFDNEGHLIGLNKII